MSEDQPASSNTSLPPDVLHQRSEILRESEALIAYIGRHGDVLKGDKGHCTDYAKLVEAAFACRKSGVDSDSWKCLCLAYAKVTRHTYATRGVNGRSLLDTWNGLNSMFGKLSNASASGERKRWRFSFVTKSHRRPLVIGLVLFLAALIVQVAAGWAGRIDDPSALSGIDAIAYWSVSDLAPLILAAVWGGIGSCIFLMKRLSDKLFQMAYEKSRQKGDIARIFVGAFLGVAVVEIFFPEYDQSLAVGEVSFGPSIAALAVGLSVKPIYAAFETAAESIAARISGPNS